MPLPIRPGSSTATTSVNGTTRWVKARALPPSHGRQMRRCWAALEAAVVAAAADLEDDDDGAVTNHARACSASRGPAGAVAVAAAVASLLRHSPMLGPF